MSVQLILKNSSVQDKAATAQQLEIGEIALNYHESGPFLQCKDTAGQVWRIGGVIVADEAPGQPQPGTWWFETDTKGLYFYDGTGWTEITGGGGGAGDITAVVAGEGLSGGGNSGTVTLDADLDLTKGLEFIVHGVDGSKIAIKPGANISFDTDGSLRADVGGASIKGSVDLTGATIPSPVNANDGYYNTVSGTLSTEWQAATGLGAISVEPSDLVVFNGTNWTYVPAAPSAVASVFGRVGAVVATEGDYDIGQLGDVDTTSAVPTNGDVLQYDGTNWVPVNETVAVPVQSVHGRTGAVVSAEGDYDLDQLGDVDLTSTPPVNNDVLQYNGSSWVPVTGTSLGYWNRTGTVLSAANTGDQIQLTGALDVNDQPINTTVTDGDIDLDANGAGLIQVTEFNLSQVPIVTQHDIGTDANEVPLNGMLGGMAFQDPASVSVDGGNFGGLTVDSAAADDSVTLDSSGRLLVGTSSSIATGSSTAGLQLHNTTTANGAFLSVARFANDTIGGKLAICKSRNSTVAAGTIVQSGDTVGVIEFAADDGTDLSTKAAEIAAYVDGTPGANDMPGRLVFSTTADGASSPTERMRISSDGKYSAFTDTSNVFSSARTSGTDYHTIFKNNASAIDGGITVCSVQADGDLENTNNSYTGISDIKLKENIVNASSQWDDLKALQVRNYNFKAETGFNTHTQIGLIAQEVELVSPGLVGETIDEETGDSTKSVNYSVLYMKAVKALQEAMERIETLEAKVTALEGGSN